MARICVCLFFLIGTLSLWNQRAECGLISQSSITKCEWGSSQEPTTGEEKAICKKKFVISMTLKSGQGENEALYANVRQAYQEGMSELSTLKKPFRIEISKTQTIASYRAYYRSSVNGRPKEHVIYKRHPRDCNDNWNLKRPSCGKQQAVDGSYVWDSQGFCCRCNYETRELRRPNATCERNWFDGNYHGYIYRKKVRKHYGSSAHCMTQNPLWFDVFQLDQPMMQYNITVRLLQFNGFTSDPDTETETANWTTVSTFYLNPSRSVSRSKDGRVVAELQGDLLGARGPLDLTTKMLLIPSIRVVGRHRKPPIFIHKNPKYWMLVDENMVDLSGLQCNKIGVSYSGFRRQPGRCHQDYKSCFTNQPFDLMAHDGRMMDQKKKGSYLLPNFGRIHPSTHIDNNSFIIRLIHDDLHNSFVTFRIDASDIQFVFNVGKGRIVDARTTEFKALTDIGKMYVEVENTGEITAEFTVVLSECFGRKNLPGKGIIIEPGKTQNVTFLLQSYKMFGENSVCEVQLFDSNFNLLGTAKVDVKVKSNCFCYGACGCSCLEDGTATMMECPTPPPIIVEEKGLALRVFLLCLEIIGPQGFIGFFAVLLLFFGCIKLCFGGILFCRKSKAQEHWDSQKEKGVTMKGPQLVKCAGECRGAKAAKARYKRKVERIKKMGKSVRVLDDWRNTSFICTCHEELADIRFLQVIKALCFFYYILFVPFIWLGKKLWWGLFKDTADKKEAAKKAVLKGAKKKGKLEKYGIIDIQVELEKIKNQSKAVPEAENKPDENGRNQPGAAGQMNVGMNTALKDDSKMAGTSKAENKKEKKEKKVKDSSKKATENVTDSKNQAAGEGKVNKTASKKEKEGVFVGKTTDNILAGGKDAKKIKGDAGASRAKDPLAQKCAFGDELVVPDKKQFSGEKKTDHSPSERQQSAKSSSMKPRKQKTHKLMKEQKDKSSNKSHKYSSHSSKRTHHHSDSGKVDKHQVLSPDKLSSVSIGSKEKLKNEDGSKHSITNKTSKAQISSDSVKETKSKASTKSLHSSSKGSVKESSKTMSHHSKVSKGTSHSSLVSDSKSRLSHVRDSKSHRSHVSDSKSRSSHVSDSKSHSSHVSDSKSHSSHVSDSKSHSSLVSDSKSHISHTDGTSSHSSHSSDFGPHSSHVSGVSSHSTGTKNDTESDSTLQHSRSDHSQKDSSSHYTSLSNIIPIPTGHSGSSVASRSSLATSSSDTSTSVSSVVPLTSQHSDSSGNTSSIPSHSSSSQVGPHTSSQSSFVSHIGSTSSFTHSGDTTSKHSSSEVSRESSLVSIFHSIGGSGHSESEHSKEHSDSEHTEPDNSEHSESESESEHSESESESEHSVSESESEHSVSESEEHSSESSEVSESESEETNSDSESTSSGSEQDSTDSDSTSGPGSNQDSATSESHTASDSHSY